MLTRETVIDRIEITEQGVVQVRRATWFVEDNVRVGNPEYHRAAYVDGDDLSREDPAVQAHAALAWKAREALKKK